MFGMEGKISVRKISFFLLIKFVFPLILLNKACYHGLFLVSMTQYIESGAIFIMHTLRVLRLGVR
mgnify:CR=1 FL=1